MAAAQQPAGQVAAPVPLVEKDVPKAEENDDDDDVFGDILKIFNKRD